MAARQTAAVASIPVVLIIVPPCLTEELAPRLSRLAVTSM
jgi:hypothetical protein